MKLSLLSLPFALLTWLPFSQPATPVIPDVTCAGCLVSIGGSTDHTETVSDSDASPCGFDSYSQCNLLGLGADEFCDKPACIETTDDCVVSIRYKLVLTGGSGSPSRPCSGSNANCDNKKCYYGWKFGWKVWDNEGGNAVEHCANGAEDGIDVEWEVYDGLSTVCTGSEINPTNNLWVWPSDCKESPRDHDCGETEHILGGFAWFSIDTGKYAIPVICDGSPITSSIVGVELVPTCDSCSPMGGE